MQEPENFGVPWHADVRTRRSIKKLSTVNVIPPSNELNENYVFGKKKGSIKLMRPLENHDYESSASLIDNQGKNKGGSSEARKNESDTTSTQKVLRIAMTTKKPPL